MSHRVEIKIEDEVYALVKKAAEAGRHGKPCTIPEMVGDLVTTGVFRRIAANKWAKAHASPKKGRKVKARTAKKVKKAAERKPAQKAPAKPKVKRPAKVKAPGAPVPPAPPPAVQEPIAASPSLLE